jgi:NADH:ubiquinone oxidoreductase subunit 4 (subunit M)
MKWYILWEKEAELGFSPTTPPDVYEMLGLDGLSFVLVLLTAFIFPFCVLLSRRLVTDDMQGLVRFVRLLLTLEIVLILAFSALDILLFYVFFESSLIPMFLIVGSYGSRARRIKASYYLFFFTLVGSIFMLFGIFVIAQLVGSTSYLSVYQYTFTQEQQLLLWLCFFLAFAVKVPMVPFHI